ncbi:MAG: PTS sugar transporter [Lacticaseibacillus rhamnosus]|jgi:PTS system N-acetylgalactosamine-specific IIA component|uniref:EIIAB-Man n=2 Tax=Lacticaseibacillus paracasei TaxID=1597 RepID=A0A422M0H4_LACPA|nr:hypothetical protein [Lacticaseibacillus paracasei]AHJ34571.1 hypothetical protein AF91_15400 [Lacticaseibacillus paracasei N1115]MDY0837442.1 PTS sugar transporter [Lacticaseibacillus paracasei]QOP56539.1 PTS sugar transporter [Lacticaseibacillus paracasei]QPC26387.1 PTS sugar transporter [Lacticaseibacillus paracasei subsp. tolerans]QPC29269.1 PTS sugar transporter [Lacticaseibacillus paracasei subsp. tolerans]
MAKIHTIITGHGNFATGLGSSVALLAGKQENFDFVDFTEDMGEADVDAKLRSLIKPEESVLIFTDLVGGTPYKCAAKIAYEMSDRDIAVVAGCNLASLLETIFGEYSNSEEYASALVKSSKLATQVLDLTPSDESDNSEDDGGGI